MSLDPLHVLLGEVSVQVLCPFFNWVACLLEWSRMTSLYILEIKPLSEVSLANMFSHMVGSKTHNSYLLNFLFRFLLLLKAKIIFLLFFSSNSILNKFCFVKLALLLLALSWYVFSS